MKIEPTIDGLRLGVWKALMVSYTVGAAEFKNGHILPPLSVFPIWLEGNIGLRQVILDFDFEGDPHEITKNISNMTSVLQRGVEILLPDGFYYRCVFRSASDPSEKAPWIKRCKFTLYGVCHDALHVETLTQSSNIFVEGNRTTPVTFEVTPAAGSIEVTVNGITVQDVTGVVIINGIDKTVSENGSNKFGSTNMTKFPSLQPGDQRIDFTGASSVKVSYYPVYA